MYLRGIQFPDMESIMQFIYLGEATFYEERMDEFLAVAKSLQIKELCNAQPESNDEPDDKPDEPSPCDPATENLEEKTVMSDHIKMQVPLERQKRFVSVNGKYECDQCHKTYPCKQSLYRHNQTDHQGVKYVCDQCDYQARYQRNLTAHIQSKHEGVKYPCDQCKYQAPRQDSLTVHIKSKHEGIKYACDQCDQQFTQKNNLSTHIKNKHDV